MVEMAEAACFLKDATPDRFSLPRTHACVEKLFFAMLTLTATVS
jgi:hypothetical protein